MKTAALGFVLALAIVLTACGRRGEQALIFSAEATQQWETARAAADAEAISRLYTEDAQLMPPNAPVVEGRSAIRSYYRNVFEAAAAPARYDEREVIVFGDITYRQGIYELALPDGRTEYGKFMQLWKNVDGNWRLHRAMWSSSEEAAPPATAVISSDATQG
jgi:uncharacterized protein (TIGR02246 family)